MSARRVALALAPFVALAIAAVVVVPMLLFSGGAGASLSATLTGQTCQVAQSVPTGALDAQKVAALAAAAGFTGDDIGIAVAVARAESGWNPLATNLNTNGSVDHGLMQINDVNASILSQGDWRVPLDNMIMAFKIFTQAGGWTPWSTYNSGSYRQYLQPVATDQAGCTPAGTGNCKISSNLSGYANGEIPLAALCPLWANPNKRLRADAANAFDALSKAYVQNFGAKPCVTDAYRDLATQKEIWITKPGLAAVPGTSNHGLGIAVDLGCGANDAGTPVDVWLHANAPRCGWVHPAWAEPSGSKPEPWHWEFHPSATSSGE